jgi:hypothetical protein
MLKGSPLLKSTCIVKEMMMSYDDINSPGYIMSICGRSVNNSLKSVWKEAVIVKNEMPLLVWGDGRKSQENCGKVTGRCPKISYRDSQNRK